MRAVPGVEVVGTREANAVFARLPEDLSVVLPLEKLNIVFRTPHITRRRVILALAVAIVADGLQLLLEPIAWTFAQSAVDVVAMILTMWILGFHLLLLPTFLIELIPVVDSIPTWSACVVAVIALRKRNQNSTTQ
jgi:hypothetical protein